MKKNPLKIAVIGGGSSYTPELIEGILVRQDHLPVLARRMAAKAGADIQIHATMDRPSAIRGADFVITQFRVGGLDARAKDESIPLKYVPLYPQVHVHKLLHANDMFHHCSM